MSDRTVTVSIGRNVGEDTLDADDWEAFQEQAVWTVGDLGGIVVFKGVGQGIWDGGVEEAYTVVASIEEDANVTAAAIDRFSTLAGQWDQETIAVTFGYTVFADA